MKRRYFSSLPAPDEQRCKAEVKAAHGNPDGRCMRFKVVGDYCLQHHRAGQGDNAPSSTSNDSR